VPEIAGNAFIRAVDPIWEGQSGTPFQLSAEREYVQAYLVHVKSKYVSEIMVCRAPGIPILGAPYIALETEGNQIVGLEFDELALATKISAARHDQDDWQFWVVTVLYSTFSRGGNGGIPDPSKQNDPTADPPTVSWDFEVKQVAPNKDATGKPFLNSAHMPFSPAFTIEVAYPVLNLSRNEFNFNRAKSTDYAYAVNGDTFLGAPPGAVQCLPPKADMQNRGGKRYWRMTYKLRFAVPLVDGTFPMWQPEVLDAGLDRIQDATPAINFGMPTPIIKPGFGPVTKPDLLDGMGQPVKADPVTHLRTPHYLNFTTYKTLSFTSLLVNGLS
jgi:hypothetical protein